MTDVHESHPGIDKQHDSTASLPILEVLRRASRALAKRPRRDEAPPRVKREPLSGFSAASHAQATPDGVPIW
jgi:hypothetical protein